MYIGIDVGGMSIKAGIVNEKGEIIAKHAVDTPLDGNDSFCAALLESIEGVMKITDTPKEEIKAIGIGYPGVVEREKGILVNANNIPGENIPIGSYLKENFKDVPVLVDNDANCAALGEFYCADDTADFVFITLGTGIGGGIIIDKKLYTGSNGAGGELGHIVTHHNGKKCSCGRKGCWEAYASVTALKNLTEENREKLKLVSPDEVISGRTVFDAAKNGDSEAVRVRDEWIEEVSIGITDMVNIFQPKELVIGGAISKEGDVLINPIREYVKENSFDVGDLPKTKIMASRIGGDAGILGAAYLYKNANNT